MWYSQEKEELEKDINYFLSQRTRKKIDKNKVHGIIVPHAGYEFSGKVAGKAFSILKDIEDSKKKKAVIIAPSHSVPLKGILTSDRKEWETPLGKIKLFNEGFDKADINMEHAIDNEIPFIQKIGFKEVLPLMAGNIKDEHAKRIAEKLAEIPAIFVISTDLSHFLQYRIAKKKDGETIKIIKNLDLKKFPKADACGFFPLLILIHLCKIKGWKPRLVEYKNSGDITKDKESVVGYASFVF